MNFDAFKDSGLTGLSSAYGRAKAEQELKDKLLGEERDPLLDFGSIKSGSQKLLESQYPCKDICEYLETSLGELQNSLDSTQCLGISINGQLAAITDINWSDYLISYDLLFKDGKVGRILQHYSQTNLTIIILEVFTEKLIRVGFRRQDI